MYTFFGPLCVYILDSKKHCFFFFEISESVLFVTFDGVWQSMLSDCIAYCKENERWENFKSRNTGHGTADTKIATEDIPKAFVCISFVKNITCDRVCRKQLLDAWKLIIPSIS